MESKAYVLHALSPLHAGTGHAADVIDLPIARMKATGIPIVLGSSVKGVLRDARRHTPPDKRNGDNAWDGKPVAVMGASPSSLGTARCQYQLRQCFLYLNVIAVTRPEVMLGNASERFDAALKLTDEKSREMVTRLVAALVALIRAPR